MNRAFGAGGFWILDPGAMPQAGIKRAIGPKLAAGQESRSPDSFFSSPPWDGEASLASRAQLRREFINLRPLFFGGCFLLTSSLATELQTRSGHTELTGEDGGPLRIELTAALNKIYGQPGPGEVVDVETVPARPALPEQSA